MVSPLGCGSCRTFRCASCSSSAYFWRSSSICWRLSSLRSSSFFSNPFRQSASSTTAFAPDALEWPNRRDAIASGHHGDAPPTRALLRDRGPDTDRVLRLDRRGDRHHVPLDDGVMVAEIASARVGIGGGVLHLPHRVHWVGAHRQHGRAIP